MIDPLAPKKNNFIRNCRGQLWSRRKKQWMDTENWSTIAIQNECGYPTFRGCDRVALSLSGSKEWGAISV